MQTREPNYQPGSESFHFDEMKVRCRKEDQENGYSTWEQVKAKVEP